MCYLPAIGTPIVTSTMGVAFLRKLTVVSRSKFIAPTSATQILLLHGPMEAEFDTVSAIHVLV